MSLHHKILLLIFFTFSSLILTLYLTTHHLVLDSFVWLERSYVTCDARQAEAAFQRIQDQLGQTAANWSKWDEVRDFAEGRHPDFIKRHLRSSTLADLKLNMVLFFGPDGRIIYGKAVDPLTRKEIDLPERLQEAFNPDSRLLQGRPPRKARTGLMRLPQGLMIVALHTIEGAYLEEPASTTTLVVARQLNPEEFIPKNEPFSSGLTLRELSPAEIAARAEQTTTPLEANAPQIGIKELDPAKIMSTIPLRDIQGRPVAELTLVQPRTIYQHGRCLITYFVLILLLLGLVFSVLMTIAIKKLFLDRLTRMNARLKRISEQGDTTARLKLKPRGRDEMATLGAAINQMLDSLVKADAELLILNDNLESMVSARTIDLALANEALIQEIAERSRAEAALKEADRRKDEFLAMLAHELRNPLAPVRTITRLLQQGEGGGRNHRRHMEIIERQVAHMSRLLDDLLDVSRITQGKVELRRDRVDLRQVLDNVLDTMRGIIHEHGHTLAWRRPDKALWLEGDQTRLEQIFYNLIHNAVKYTEGAGTIEIGVETETRPAPDGAAAVIRIRDNGIGIDSDLLPHVFDLFVQADRSLDRSRGGLGLGLTLVDRLVRMHGGTVEARSEGPGRGSEFTVRLPVVRGGELSGSGEAVGDAAAAPEALQETAPAEGVGQRRLLVVEDNLDTASAMAELLEVWGYQVRVAYDGPMAIEMATLFAPEIVLLDIGLPYVDGYEVARQLRETGALTPMMIVALTGYSQDEDRKQAQDAGCDHFLAKPVQLDELRAVLERVNELERLEGLEPAME